MKADATHVLTTNYVVFVLSQFVCMRFHVPKLKCVSCGGEHMATSRSCPVWQREKEIVSVKYREGFSVLSGSYAMAAKGNQAKTPQLQDAQTQTDVAVQTEIKTPPKTNSNKSSAKPVQHSVSSPKSPVKNSNNSKTNKPEKILSDRLPKGSDDPIQQHNRFQCLDEDMEAESAPAESANKQGRIIKLNKK